MWLTLTAVLAAGTFQVDSGAEPARVVGKGGSSACYRIAPEELSPIAGPATAKLAVRIDLQKRARRPKPVTVVIEVNGDLRSARITPKPSKRARYDPPGRKGSRPSQATKPIPVELGPGRHELRIRLEGKATGCVTIMGVEPGVVGPAKSPPAPSESTPAADPNILAGEPEASSKLDLSLPEPTRPPPAEPVVEPVVEPTVEPVVGPSEEPMAVPVPKKETARKKRKRKSRDGKDIELVALPAESEMELTPVPTVSAGEESFAPAEPDIIRIGPKFGGLFPRGNLKSTFFAGLTIEIPLPFNLALGGAFVELSPYLEGGWSPMMHQRIVITPERGRTKLIQNTLALPFEIGIRARFDLDAWIEPMVSVAFAMDATWTELQIFSLDPIEQQRLAFGGAVALGLYMPIGPGGFLIEARYREVQTRFTQLGDLAEPIFSSGSAHLSYIFAVPRSGSESDAGADQ